MKTLRILVSTLVLTAFCAAIAQQPVAPPPKPAADGPSLVATMQFIQNKLNDFGKTNWVAFLQDSTNGSTGSVLITNETSNVVADPGQCRVSYHWRVTNDGKINIDQNGDFYLSDVQDILVEPYEKANNDWMAKNGHPNITTTSSNPPMTTLVVRTPRGEANFFFFADAALAERVAKAFTHAIELCGGGNKEPF